MSSKPGSLHSLSRELPSTDEFSSFIRGIEESEPRAAALAMGALLDNMLELAIATHFVELGQTQFDRIFRASNAPLSSFSSKIAIGFALGLYDTSYRSHLDRIRSIRNMFAHSIKHFDFDNDVVSAECLKLEPKELLDGGFTPDKNTPKERFYTSSFVLAAALMQYVTAKREGRPVPTPYRCKVG